jgi:hypothetical protein
MRLLLHLRRQWPLALVGAALCLLCNLACSADERTTDKSNWWSFKPSTRPAIPHSAVGNPIDAFIRAKLAGKNLQPSTEADPVTLIRRLTFDLTGLPPTPEEVEAFVREFSSAPFPPFSPATAQDKEQRGKGEKGMTAWEHLVDRLLASPRYGERWARHWLDVVHFGETHGYDKDKLRPYAWPYRDYVIRAFNDDKPWSRFVEEQLAGDVLYPDEPDGVVALGFVAAGPWDFVGHVELPITKTDGLIARYNDRDDMVMTTFSTFQSLTVHCARCHDHKFDPISQKDYYRLQAVFAGVDRANRPYDPDPAVHRRRRALTGEQRTLGARQGELKTALAKLTSPELARLDEQIAGLNERLGRNGQVENKKKSPSNGYHSNIEPKPDVTKWVQVDLGLSVTLDEIRLVPARPTDFPDTPGFGFPLRFKVDLSDEPAFTKAQILADHTVADFKNPKDAPVVFSFAAVTNAPFPLTPALAPGERGPGTPTRDDTGRVRPRDAQSQVLPLPKGEGRGEGEGSATPPAVSPPPAARYIRVTASRLWERTGDYVFALGELQAFANGSNVARGATVTALDSIEAGRWARKNLVDGYSSRARLQDIAPTPAQLAERRAWETEVQQLAGQRQRLFDSLIPAQIKSETMRVESRLAELRKEIAALPEPKQVYAAAHEFKPEGSFVPPKGMRPVHFLPRGDVKRPQELMPPAALACVPGPESVFDLKPDHSEGDRRAALAKWLTDPRNLQTRRSIVNRVWQYHFGRGLVDTPNDFGHMGSQPTHPELLDWLAYWFLDNGESLKKLHRLMVTSATYRQTSVAADVRRLTSEPETRNAKPGTNQSLLTSAATVDQDNRYLWRQNRTRLDAECIRDAMLFVSGQLDLTMGGPSDRQFHFKDDHSPVYDYTRFDVDAKEGRRRSIYRHIVRSVTDPFMDCLDAADPSQLVARRNTTLTALQALATLNNPLVLKQSEHFAARLGKVSPETPAQIEAAYRLALSRPPTPEEKDRLSAYARKHGLANACRVLFNSTEFMFVD